MIVTLRRHATRHPHQRVIARLAILVTRMTPHHRPSHRVTLVIVTPPPPPPPLHPLDTHAMSHPPRHATHVHRVTPIVPRHHRHRTPHAILVTTMIHLSRHVTREVRVIVIPTQPPLLVIVIVLRGLMRFVPNEELARIATNPRRNVRRFLTAFTNRLSVKLHPHRATRVPPLLPLLHVEVPPPALPGTRLHCSVRVLHRHLPHPTRARRVVRRRPPPPLHHQDALVVTPVCCPSSSSLSLSYSLLSVLSTGGYRSGGGGGGSDKPKAQRDHAKALADIEKKGIREKRKVENDHQRLEKELARYWKEVERKMRDATRKEEQHSRQVERDARDNDKDMETLNEAIAKKEAVRVEREEQVLERFEERIVTRVTQLNTRRGNKLARWTTKTDKRRLRNDLLQAKRVVRLKHRQVEKIARIIDEDKAEMDRRRRRREHFLFGYQSQWDEKKIQEAQEVQKLNPWKPPPKREVERYFTLTHSFIHSTLLSLTGCVESFSTKETIDKQTTKELVQASGKRRSLSKKRYVFVVSE